jgi:signal transduction histidine kinase
MNVALNAIQAMARGGGRLVVAARRDDGAIALEVVDTGDGIAPEVMRRIFEPFFTTKPAGKGTGLGLFITHQIVSDLGGTITVRSEPGAGTTVSIRLPPDEEAARS